MGIKIALFINLLLYSLVISQSFFYLIALSRTIRSMQALTYIEYRQLIDRHIRVSLPAVYYLTLSASIALTALCVVNPGGPLFIASVIALLALLADIVVAKTGNEPLNKTINTWTSGNYPSNWQQYRSRWFMYYRLRQFLNSLGFIALLAALVFGIN